MGGAGDPGTSRAPHKSIPAPQRARPPRKQTTTPAKRGDQKREEGEKEKKKKNVLPYRVKALH